MFTKEDFPRIGYKVIATTLKDGMVSFEAHSTSAPKHLVKGAFRVDEGDALDDLYLQCVVRSQ